MTLWEIPSGKVLRTIIVNKEIATYTNSVVFTPNGKGLPDWNVTICAERVFGQNIVRREKSTNGTRRPELWNESGSH